MNATRAQLSEMQEDIAKGRMPDGVRDGDYIWHPHFRLALRPYSTGRGIWVVKYYNKGGDERSYKIGSAAAINLTTAEKIAKDVFGRVARVEDPAGERKRPKGRRTVGELLRLFCESEQGLLEIGENGPRYADPTKRAYRKLEKRYLGSLAHVDSIELCERQNDIVDHITKITEKVSPFVARQVRNQLSRIFIFGMRRFPDDYKKNPVVGTWMPEAPAPDKRSLDLDEMTAIWRACERMTATAVPLYKGNPNGTPAPILPNSIRADETIMTVRQAARQCGLHWGTLKMEIGKDRIPIMSRHELPAHHPILVGHHHPHNTQFIKAADLNEFVKMRTVLTRSGAGDYGMIVRLLMLLGRRYSEMGGIRWGELECECEVCRRDRKEFRHRTLHIRTVAEEDEHRRVKSRHGWKKDIFVYLPQAAIDILDQAKRRPGISCLFGDDPRGLVEQTGKKNALDDLICEMEGGDPQVLADWRKLDRKIRQQLGLKKGHQLSAIVKEARKTSQGAELYKRLVPKPWNIHLLRHSFVTHMQTDMHCPPWLVGAIANHSDKEAPKTTGRYTHTAYLSDQKRYLDGWAQHILNAANRVQRDAANVTPLFPSAESA